MKFTFGIITDGKNVARVRKIVASINNLGISPNKHEIIVVCPRAEQYGADTILYVFDETKKPLWITAKKNMITKIASHENIVYLHDYISFNENWYKGFLKMGNDWDICMNVILNKDGTRYRDWCLFPDFCKDIHVDGHLLDYNIDNLKKYMYISGAYWVAKRKFMLANMLDEKLMWGESEDVAWSKQTIHNPATNYRMNVNSTVHLLKQKRVIFAKY